VINSARSPPLRQGGKVGGRFTGNDSKVTKDLSVSGGVWFVKKDFKKSSGVRE